MYAPVGGIESIGRKIISVADKVAAGATKVSGAVKGAAVGAQTAPAHSYLVPVLIGVAAFLALQLLASKRGSR